jgi:multidrug efflux pump subunit AcrA (membrane-fusion protein)
VIFIYPVLNAETRSARIRVTLANPGLRLKIQMAVEGSITITYEKSLAIPASAVVRTGEKNVVWVKRDDGMFYPREVVLDYRDADNYYVVRSGLEEGDEIVASGTFLVDSERQLNMYSTMSEMDHGKTQK